MVKMSELIENSTCAWYCARTKPKHEHIAAANIERQLGCEVFNPRLRVERATRRGLVRTVEPLFPCYIFVETRSDTFNEVRYVPGVSTLVHFGFNVATVPYPIIEDLKRCFEKEDALPVQEALSPGTEVSIVGGAFQGFSAVVLQLLPARKRVQVLLDILGRQTLVEVDRHSVISENRNMADLLPSLAAV